MKTLLLVLAATLGIVDGVLAQGSFPVDQSKHRTPQKPAALIPAPGRDAIEKSRQELDAAIRATVRPAAAEMLPVPRRNPIRQVGYDEDSGNVAPAQFTQSFPRRGIDGQVGAQSRRAATDPTRLSGNRLQTVPRKPTGYENTPPAQRPSPFLPSPFLPSPARRPRTYGDPNKDIYQSVADKPKEADPSLPRKSPAYRPPSSARNPQPEEESAKDAKMPDLSLMFPEDGDSEYNAYEAQSSVEPSTLRLEPVKRAVKQAGSVYGQSSASHEEITGYGDPLPATTAQPSRNPIQLPTVTPQSTTQHVPQQPARDVRPQLNQALGTPQVNQRQYAGYPQSQTGVQNQQPAPQNPNRIPAARSPITASQPIQQQTSLPQIPAPTATTTPMMGQVNMGRPLPASTSTNTVMGASTPTPSFSFLTLLALMASIGLNIYLGWIAYDTYNRYQDLVADLSYKGERRDRGGDRSERRERRLADAY